MNTEEVFKKLQPEEYLQHHVEKGLRSDGRDQLTSVRPVSISTGVISTADGSAVVKQGNTVVTAGVRLELAKPDEEAPDKGFFVPNLELTPLCHPKFKPGPPPEKAQIAANFIKDTLISSKFLDEADLCISKERKLVWTLFLDLVCLNLDGNLLDCALKSATSALKNVRLPKIEVKEAVDRDENGEELPQSSSTAFSDFIQIDPEEKVALKCGRMTPISVSMIVIDGEPMKVLIDPTEEEESTALASLSIPASFITVVLDPDSDTIIQCQQTPGSSGSLSLKPDVLTHCIALAKKNATVIKKMLDAALKQSNKPF